MINEVDAHRTIWCDWCWTRTGMRGLVAGQVPAGWRKRSRDGAPDLHACPEHAPLLAEMKLPPSAPRILSAEEKEARLTEVGVKVPAK